MCLCFSVIWRWRSHRPASYSTALRVKARWWRLERGRPARACRKVVCGGTGATRERGGVERQGGPWFLDSPPGPRWETWEGASVAGAQGACVVSPVLGCGWSGKSWQASGAGGEGQLPLIQEESEQRARHPRLLGLKVFPDLHVLVELSLQRQVVLERLPLTSVGFVPCSG